MKSNYLKHLMLMLLVSTISFPLMSQSIQVWGEKYYKKRFYHDFFVDLGGNRAGKQNMFNGNEDISAADFPKQRGTSFAMYSMFGHRFTRNFSITSGLGFDWANYKFGRSMTIIEDANEVTGKIPISDILDYNSVKKSKLTTSYLNVPILLRFDFHNRFFVAAGITGGINVGSHTKIKYKNVNDVTRRYKDRDTHMAPFRFGYTARAGFHGVSVFANYTTTSLFSKNEGPQVYPYSMGISFRMY